MGFASKVKKDREQEKAVFDEESIKPSLADRVIAYFGNLHAQTKIDYWEAVGDLVDAYRQEIGKASDRTLN